MRGFDAVATGLALLFVPLLAWMVGRACGRRDAGAMGVIVSAVIAAALAQALAMLASSGIEAVFGASKMPFATALARRFGDLGSVPEFFAFLSMFGIFVGMVGWSSVPAMKPVRVAAQ